MMKPLKIEEAVKAASGICFNQSKEYITDVSIDSREDLEGKAFFAIRGQNFDGHDFVAQAFDKNCALAVVNWDYKAPEAIEGRCLIRVDDTTKALQDIARCYLDCLSVLKVAVTGSVGKTTTREMLHAIFQTKYNTLQNIKNFNNEIGVPLTIFRIEEGHEAAIFEMGMNHAGEIRLLAELVRPHIAVITNIGTAHIENLGSKEGILEAKWEVTEFLKEDGTIVINGDDPLLMEKSKKEQTFSVIRAGQCKENDFRADRIKNDEANETAFVMTYNGKEQEMRLKMPGVHNVFNAALAAAAANAAGISMAEAAKGLLSVKNQAGRLHIKNGIKDITVIDDTYNANPDSAKAALLTLKDMPGDKKVAILGDMLELGSFAGEGHRATGRVASQLNIDIVLAVGAYAEDICTGCDDAKDLKTKTKAVAFSDKQSLIAAAWQYIHPSDIVLVKGSRGMKMEEIVKHLIEK